MTEVCLVWVQIDVLNPDPTKLNRLCGEGWRIAHVVPIYPIPGHPPQHHLAYLVREIKEAEST